MRYAPFHIELPREKLDFMSVDTVRRAARPIAIELPEEYKFVEKQVGKDDADFWWFIPNPTLGNAAPAQVLFLAPAGKSKLKKWFKALMEGKDPWEGIVKERGPIEVN